MCFLGISVSCWYQYSRFTPVFHFFIPYYFLFGRSASFLKSTAMAQLKVDEFWAKADKHLMSTGVPYSPAIITRALRTKLYDHNGREILDFTSGQMSSLLGHSHPEIVEVVRENVAQLDHLLSNMITQPVIALAERLARFLPAPLEKSFFLNTGSETTEAAIKMAKVFTGKFEIIAFTASFHGLT